jgi:Flp pilus assembly pilin Flp
MCKDPQARAAMAVLRFVADEQAATSIEYALIAAGIGAVLATTVYSLGGATKALYSRIYAVL